MYNKECECIDDGQRVSVENDKFICCICGGILYIESE